MCLAGLRKACCRGRAAGIRVLICTACAFRGVNEPDARRPGRYPGRCHRETPRQLHTGMPGSMQLKVARRRERCPLSATPGTLGIGARPGCCDLWLLYRAFCLVWRGVFQTRTSRRRGQRRKAAPRIPPRSFISWPAHEGHLRIRAVDRGSGAAGILITAPRRCLPTYRRLIPVARRARRLQQCKSAHMQ